MLREGDQERFCQTSLNPPDNSHDEDESKHSCKYFAGMFGQLTTSSELAVEKIACDTNQDIGNALVLPVTRP